MAISALHIRRTLPIRLRPPSQHHYAAVAGLLAVVADRAYSTEHFRHRTNPIRSTTGPDSVPQLSSNSHRPVLQCRGRDSNPRLRQLGGILPLDEPRKLPPECVPAAVGTECPGKGVALLRHGGLLSGLADTTHSLPQAGTFPAATIESKPSGMADWHQHAAGPGNAVTQPRVPAIRTRQVRAREPRHPR